jgi:hypothetical protein
MLVIMKLLFSAGKRLPTPNVEISWLRRAAYVFLAKGGVLP